jgi:hypothetical protein
MTHDMPISYAKKLHGILSDLWPLLRTQDLAIIIDSASWSEGSVGFHLDNPDLMDQYVESLPADHPARALVEPRYPTHLIVIDHKAALEGGGWRELVLTGLHEFAHAIRNDLAEGLYPDFHTLRAVSGYLENRLGETMGTDEAPPAHLLVTDDLMNDVEFHLFQWEGSKNKPLFGDWVVRTFQHDGGHDLLFYLVLYMLEREATDRGYFKDISEVARSVFMPERADANL